MHHRSRRSGAITAISVLALLLLGAGLVFVSRPASQVDAAEFPTTRDPRKWPFAWDSIWNIPIGDGARYVPADIAPAGAMGMTVDENIIVLEPDAPKTNVVLNTAGWDNQHTRCGSVSGGQAIANNVPIPTDFSTDPGYQGLTPNMAAAVLLEDGSTVMQTQPFHRCGSGGAVTSQYVFASGDIRSGDGVLGAHGGSGMSSLGGAIRVGELVPGGTIRHALKVELDCERLCYYNGGESDGMAGFRWPAVAADSGAPGRYHGANPGVQMGSLLALPPDFDESRLATEPAKILARALRDYGSYVVDDTGWSVYALATEWGPQGRVIDEFAAQWGFNIQAGANASCGDGGADCTWAKDMATLFTSLNVVDNNSPEAVGGGGQRRAPCAPPFTDGGGAAPADCGPAAPGGGTPPAPPAQEEPPAPPAAPPTPPTGEVPPSPPAEEQPPPVQEEPQQPAPDSGAGGEPLPAPAPQPAPPAIPPVVPPAVPPVNNGNGVDGGGGNGGVTPDPGSQPLPPAGNPDGHDDDEVDDEVDGDHVGGPPSRPPVDREGEIRDRMLRRLVERLFGASGWLRLWRFMAMLQRVG